MVELVGKKMPYIPAAESLCLIAKQSRVFVESDQTAAGADSFVQSEGQCLLPRTKFLEVLKTYKGKKHLTFEVDADGLRIGNFLMRVYSFSSKAIAPAKFQVFPVKGLPVLLPNTQPTETWAAEPPAPSTPIAMQLPKLPFSSLSEKVLREGSQDSNLGFSPQEAALLPEATPSQIAYLKGSLAWYSLPEGEFFSAPDDAEVFEHVIGYVRRICTLPKIKPQELAGLAHALYALERLPRVTPGVAVDFQVGVRWGTETEHSESWATFHISEEEFNAGRMERTRDPYVGGDHQTTTVFEISRESHRTPEYEGDTGSWLRVLEWMGFVESLLEGDKTNLMLWVSDESKPDCMRGEAE